MTSPAPPPRVHLGPWRDRLNQDYWLLTQSQPDWLHPFELLGKVTSFAEFRALMAACTDYLSKDAAHGNSTPDRILRSERFRACSSLDEASFQAELESWRWHRKDWFALKQVIEGVCADGILTAGERGLILGRSRECGFSDEEILGWIESTWPDLQQQPSQGGGRIQRRVEGLLDEAERLETAKDYAGAITVYDEVLRLSPGHSEVSILRDSARRMSGVVGKTNESRRGDGNRFLEKLSPKIRQDQIDSRPTTEGENETSTALTQGSLLLKQEGKIYRVDNVATLQRWIVERRVLGQDLISRDEVQWEAVGQHVDFRVFFVLLEQMKTVVVQFSRDLPGAC